MLIYNVFIKPKKFKLLKINKLRHEGVIDYLQICSLHDIIRRAFLSQFHGLHRNTPAIPHVRVFFFDHSACQTAVFLLIGLA